MTDQINEFNVIASDNKRDSCGTTENIIALEDKFKAFISFLCASSLSTRILCEMRYAINTYLSESLYNYHLRVVTSRGDI